jgi:hypothetical protein
MHSYLKHSIYEYPFHRREIHPFKEKRRKEVKRWLWIG